MNRASDSVGQDGGNETVFVALGSNVGDRLAHLRFAVGKLRNGRGIRVRRISHVYESPAHVLEASIRHPDFLNAVVELETDLSAEQLLEELHRIERAAGRWRDDDNRWSPRTLDLDLLIFGRTTIRSEELTVPHPRLGDRRFVLCPLADLNPDLHVPPPFDSKVADLLEACPDSDRPERTSFSLDTGL